MGLWFCLNTLKFKDDNSSQADEMESVPLFVARTATDSLLADMVAAVICLTSRRLSVQTPGVLSFVPSRSFTSSHSQTQTLEVNSELAESGSANGGYLCVLVINWRLVQDETTCLPEDSWDRLQDQMGPRVQEARS